MYTWLFIRKQNYTKPIAPYVGRDDQGFGWVNLTLTPWQSFHDDRKRYGIFIAIYNLFKLWKIDHAHQG